MAGTLRRVRGRELWPERTRAGRAERHGRPGGVTGFLLDTNVLSEIVKPVPDARVLAFLERESDIWLSVVTLHELAYGAARIAEAGRRRSLTSWLDMVRARFKNRLLTIDEAVAQSSGRLRGEAARRGRVVTALDSLIAATAAARALRLVTRNVRDFEAFDISTLNPWIE